MKFKTGDICIILPGGIKKEANLIGRECTIMGTTPNPYDWEIEVAGESELYDICESNLKHLPPPNKVDSWENCVWQPKILERV